MTDEIGKWAETLELTENDVASARRNSTTMMSSIGAATGRSTDPERETRPGDTLIEFVERYQDLGGLGVGGMGIVRKAYDRVLERTVAIKIARPGLIDRPTVHERFLREANITAGLQHPGIVPVYDRGQLPDGRVWYTMREVEGDSFAEHIARFHRSRTRIRLVSTLRQLVEILVRVCDAMTYAHESGVVHRDLKPNNIMVGAFNDVLVLDWGVAMRLDAPDELEKLEDLDLDSISNSRFTVMGQVLGTPAYMAPEQAAGDLDTLGPPADVYALGAILYEVLAGRPPREGKARHILQQLRDASPIERPTAVARRVPEAMPSDLVDIAMAALVHDPAKRPATAAPIADALRAWLDGSQRRAQALELVQIAQRKRPQLVRMADRAAAMRRRAAEYLDQLPSDASADDKLPAWALEDQAEQMEIDAAIEETDWLAGLRMALTHDPDLEEAHALLADHYRAAHEAAETRRDAVEAARLETLLRTHDRGKHATYLRGWGMVTLVTDPPGAEVELMAFVLNGRRLRPVMRRHLGRTPIIDVPLAQGSYILRAFAPGRRPLDYPVVVQRGQSWSGIAPGQTRPQTIPLVPTNQPHLDGAVYVPAGWFWRGGDPDAADGLPKQRIWVDGFFIRRFPITNAEYLDFLNALVEMGHAADAERYAPRPRDGSGAKAAPSYVRTDGHFALPGAHAAATDHPVVNVDWASAMAYARWEAERTGRPWRLPDETEWAKAARGVDGRLFPWGDHLEPTWARNLGSAAEPSLAPVNAYPVDESPYGVRGMAGNTTDWCINVWKLDGSTVRDGRLVVEPAEPDDPDLRAGRGGHWAGGVRFGRLATRFADPPDRRLSVLGIRLICPCPPPCEAAG